MSTRRLTLSLWVAALLTTGLWWPLSHHYGLGFTAATPNPLASPARGHRPECGIALVSGMGKGIFLPLVEFRLHPSRLHLRAGDRPRVSPSLAGISE